MFLRSFQRWHLSGVGTDKHFKFYFFIGESACGYTVNQAKRGKDTLLVIKQLKILTLY